METGHKLDVLVSEMMGWKRKGDDDFTAPLHRMSYTEDRQPFGPYNDWQSKGPHPRLENHRGECYYFCACQKDKGVNLPSWSTDIKMAQQVIMEMVANHGYSFRLDIDHYTPLLTEAFFWSPEQGMHYKPFIGHGPMEYAICIAALKAMGVDVDNP